MLSVGRLEWKHKVVGMEDAAARDAMVGDAVGGVAFPLGGISSRNSRGNQGTSSLPTGTQEFTGKGRVQNPEKFLQEHRNS